ncbi:hypothetical protein [Rhodovarius crocodyli]|uniref:hypothetical protein n=1 Tax=Rhodovarius crocodyli TaxID=1979269 RepID=UPI00197D15CA|nr:hypothetical protein [Rhodovarius crocodyli]
MKHACRNLIILLPFGLIGGLAGCGNSYSANEYAQRAVQQANKVSQGTIVGFRQVRISADGTTGAASGAAAGGVLGAAAGGNRVTDALGAVGGALVGGLIGTAAERAANNADGIEYIVRKANNELVSVTQRDIVPLPVGARVLVIEGAQARIVADYTNVPVPEPAAPATPARVQGPRRDPPAPVAETLAAPAAPATEAPAAATPAGDAPAPVAAPAPAAEAPAAPGDPGAAAGVAPAQLLQNLPEWLRNQPGLTLTR